MKAVSPSVQFSKLEEEVLAFWKENRIFERSTEDRRDRPAFRFYDGPPFASGSPHYGHVICGTIKDVIPRYKTMQGYYVERRFGWDTHGLPTESMIEKELGLAGHNDIRALGEDKFNEACRAGVFRCVDEWRRVMPRLGRWVDFDNDYKTMDPWFMESVWWVFKRLWEEGRIYEGARVVPYSWRLSTPLSYFEASSNYKDVQDPAITVRFVAEDDPSLAFLAWTTTPWTLPANMLLCVHPERTYVEVDTGDGRVILAESRFLAYFKSEQSNKKSVQADKIVRRHLGSELVGRRYRPLFEYAAPYVNDKAYRVVSDTYVTTEDGTGIVHTAPAHGEDDYRIGQAAGAPLVDFTDIEGTFTSETPELAGKNFKEAEKIVIQLLKSKGLLFKQETLNHSYPFCDRSDTPLMFKAISAWYVRVTDLREKMVENNRRIHWVPEHIKHGRFENWLAGARDWNISRNRFWGTPLPIWRCTGCGDLECIGSRRELTERSGQDPDDLHKHFVDKITWKCGSCGGEKKRIDEVLDCWFESGSMPYAQVHYPFENQAAFEASFPADFIAEGLDQTRGWFYTLMVLSTALFGSEPFKNVVVNGMILAEDGKKMSKRLKNYPDPLEIMERHGADALRLYLINSPAVRGEPLNFSEKGVIETVKKVLLPLWNAYSLFTTYAETEKYVPSKDLTTSTNELDRWILSRMQTLTEGFRRELDTYRLFAVTPRVVEFIEDLTNWYVRRSRRRFWSATPDAQMAFDTLLHVLAQLTHVLAPLTPFFAETLYQNLATILPKREDSVHLAAFPEIEHRMVATELESDMALVITAVTLGRALRSRLNIRTRQPLRSITVITRNVRAEQVLKQFAHHIKEELNVKDVHFSRDESTYLDISVKPNFPALGPVFGPKMKEAAKEIGAFKADAIERLERGEPVTVAGHPVTSEQVQIVRAAKKGFEIETGQGVSVFFDTNITEQLLHEGLAREFVSRVQRMRKDADYKITDRIRIAHDAPSGLRDALKTFSSYITEETLAVGIETSAPSGLANGFVASESIEEYPVTIAIARAT